MSKLRTIKLAGYKSFRDAKEKFGDITVFLGANGAGKSNLVSFFKMLNLLCSGALQTYIGQHGGSDSLLHYGRQTTQQMRAEVVFADEDSETSYVMRLFDAAPDTLIFADERAIYHKHGHALPVEVLLGAGHKESNLRKDSPYYGDKTCGVLYGMLSRCRTYQFHDTSATAKIRNNGYIEDARYLRADAGNLAAFLFAMQKNNPRHYQLIVDTIRLVFPSFGDFALKPSPHNTDYILLNWTENEHPDYLFGPHQLSDGTLRFMALATLLLQPKDKIPGVIVLDEPELGLHPYAMTVFAGMVKSVSINCQVIMATQSTRLVDEFDAEQIVVLEQDRELGTQCKRLELEKLSEWLADYSLSELWEKNLFGGRP